MMLFPIFKIPVPGAPSVAPPPSAPPPTDAPPLSTGTVPIGAPPSGRTIAAPTSGPVDATPGGQLPLAGTIQTGSGTDGLAISGGHVMLAGPQAAPPAPPGFFDPTVPPTTVAPTGGPSGGGSGGSTSVSGATGTPIDTSGGPVGSPNQDTLTQSLLDFMAAQYAMGAQGGQSPDFGGLVTAPVSNATGAPDDTQGDTGAVASSSSSSSHLGLILFVLAVAAVGVWYWRKHHKKRAA